MLFRKSVSAALLSVSAKSFSGLSVFPTSVSAP